MPRSSKCLLPSGFHTNPLYVPLLSSYVPHAPPITFFCFDYPNNIR